jgi:hypothetical protein
MNSVANTRRRLAPCTPVLQCAHPAQNSPIATLHRLLPTLDLRPHGYRITVVHHQPRKTGTQNLSPQAQMLFKIHNST